MTNISNKISVKKKGKHNEKKTMRKKHIDKTKENRLKIE